MNEKLITLPWEFERSAPPFEGNDIKSPESLARYVFKNFSKKGDKIFDPFVGLGTNIFMAEDLKRIPYGIEAGRQKFEWVAGQIDNWMNIYHDDAFKLDKYNFPKMDLIFTCPPYMQRHEKWNPLYDGAPSKAGYEVYLKRMARIFAKFPNIIKANSKFVLAVDNLYQKEKFTPLVYDMAQCANKHFIQIDEINVAWKNPKEGYPLTTLLIFKKK